MLKSITLQILFFSAIFWVLTWFKSSSMLTTDQQLPPQKLLTLTNQVVDLHHRDKTTVLYFFAPWCQVCHLSISNLQALHESNPHLHIVAVALDYVDKAEVIGFTTRHQLTFDIALGTEDIKSGYKISGYPSYYVISEQNTVISRSIGYSSEIGLKMRTL